MWSHFKSLWREVRPNAFWDAIKAIIKAIFYLVAIAMASTGALAALVHYAKSVSLDFYIILGIFLCALLFAGVAYVTGRYAQKKLVDKAAISQQAQTATSNSTDETKLKCSPLSKSKHMRLAQTSSF